MSGDRAKDRYIISTKGRLIFVSIHYVVSKTKNGDWGVKRQGKSRFSIHADNKPEAIKIGRVLSIKNNGKLVIVDHSGKEREQ